MIKKMTCIECPVGCQLEVEIGESGKVVTVSRNKCPKGEKYAIEETENPVRVLTTTVLTEGLPLRTVSVKTDRPIPKARLLEAMREISKVRLRKSVKVGEVVVPNLIGLDANLIATRNC